MATSGVTTYSLTETDVISDALQSIGAYAAGETIGADDYALARRKLNMIVKQWMGSSDFAPGLKLWSRKRGYLFLQTGQAVYTLGPTGDNATSSYVATTISADEASGQTVISLTSITGISASDKIGVELDSGAIHWTTVSGAPSGGTATLAVALTGNAAAGNKVYAYTTKVRKPQEILTAVLRDNNGVDSYFDPFMSLEEYEGISDKASDGDPSGWYFEDGITNATVYLDREPNDVTKVIRFVFLSPVEDLTTTTDTIDYPQQWYRPLCAQLMLDCAPAFEKSVKQEWVMQRNEALQIARNANPETCEVYYQPGLD
jgi:hypothetical protein